MTVVAAFLLSTLLAPGMPRPHSASPEAKPGVITPLSFKHGDKDYPYWLYVPKRKDTSKPAPLILFLHGSGERAGGKKGPHEVGIGPAISKQGDNFPFYVLFPQFSRSGSWIASGADARRAMTLLDHVIKDHPIDEKRLYLTGISMGGNGTWELAIAHPKKWAAIAPVCAYVTNHSINPDHVQAIKDLPCWCFHGEKDRPVPVTQSRKMMAALWALGAHPNYTEFPGVDHNCWDITFANPQLYQWFLGHKLP
jgi:predicted peptidase